MKKQIQICGSVVLFFFAAMVANTAWSQQDCPPQMGAAGGGTATGSQAGPLPRNAISPANTQQTTMPVTSESSHNFASRGRGMGSTNVTPAARNFQAMQSMLPMGMIADIPALQAAAVAQQQARMQKRRAIREPGRQKMRERNALRYYTAGMKAESAGNYAAARKYYQRAASIEGASVSSDAQQALASLSP